MGAPLISIVIPAHNSAGTLLAATASVEIQGYRNIQIIIVDDASTDATATIMKSEFSGRLDCDVVFLECNGGPARARNRGIARAAGEWLAFLDADDDWMPDKLKIQIDLAAAHPEVAMWCGGTIPLEISAPRSAFPVPCCVPGGGDEGESPAGGSKTRPIRLEQFVTENPVATSTVLVRKEAVEAVGGFDEQFRGPEDYDLWMRIVQSYPAMLIDRPLSRYRFTAGSLSMDDRTFLTQVLRVLDKAFDDGGALEEYREFRESAVSNQLWNASWMAFHRGARGAALRYLWRAWFLNLHSRRPISRAWLRLMARYVCGRPQAQTAERSKGNEPEL